VKQHLNIQTMVEGERKQGLWISIFLFYAFKY